MSFQNCKIAGVNVSPREYHALKEKHPRGSPEFVMSPSSINAFAFNPSRWKRGWSPPDSAAKRWGNLLDCRTLTPELFAASYAVEPETYTETGMKCPACGSITDSKSCRECKETRIPVPVSKPWRYGAKITDLWKQKQTDAGLIVTSPADMLKCDAAIKRLFEVVDGDDTVQRWYDASDRQVLVTGQWHDEETGLIVPLSCLLDFAPRKDSEFSDSLGDLKAVMSGNELKFKRQAFGFGWHRQGAFDMDMFNAATGEQRTTWAFIIQENFDPWEPNRAIYGQDNEMGQPGFLTLGREKQFGGYKGILELYCKCLKTGKWPGYNATDETVQGWCVLRPDVFMAERAQFAPQFEIQESEEPPPDPTQDPDFDGRH